LEVIQQPEVSAEFGSAALSRLPLAPPLVAQLTIRDSRGNVIESDPDHPYLICHLSLHSADGLTVLDPVSSSNRQFPPDRLLYGNLVSSPHFLRNLQGRPGVYFLFPDVSVRLRGRYILQLTLMRLSRVDASGMVRVGESGSVLAQTRTRPFDVRPRHTYVAPPQTPLTEFFFTARCSNNVIDPPRIVASRQSLFQHKCSYHRFHFTSHARNMYHSSFFLLPYFPISIVFFSLLR
jgi:hypothetical protein